MPTRVANCLAPVAKVLHELVAWYDSESSYCNRLVDLAQRVLVPVAGHA
jgi:glyceraldehyde-3-phosphate dehydrogenase/erythrose-4-phosphate dehydrogenase